LNRPKMKSLSFTLPIVSEEIVRVVSTSVFRLVS
jgi:hypothetical protein